MIRYLLAVILLAYSLSAQTSTSTQTQSAGGAGTGGGGDAITSPNSTLAVGGTAGATTLDVTGAAGKILAGVTPALTFTPALGVDGTSAGTLQLANGAAAFHTILGSVASANNTVNFFATAPTTGDLVDCITATTTCTLTDAGVVAANVVTAGSAAGAANQVAYSTGASKALSYATLDNTTTHAFFATAGAPAFRAIASGDIPTLNQNTTGSAASMSISGQTALLTFTGLASTNRIKTVRDAADTFLELGGSYTPTGTWTNMTLATPSLGTPASGVITSLTGTCSACTANSATAVPAANVTAGALASTMTATTQSADDNSTKLATTAYVDRLKARTITFTFGAPEGSALSTTITRYVTVPFGCTISAYNLLADAGTFTVKFWKIATGTAIPTVTNSISTSGVSLSTGTALHSTTVTDFTTTTVTANDIMAANITAVATAKMVQAQVECDQ